MFPICSRMFLFDHVKLIHKSNIEIFRSTNFLAISNNNRIKYKEDRQITRLQNHSKKNTNPNTIKLYFNKNKIYFIIKDAIRITKTLYRKFFQKRFFHRKRIKFLRKKRRRLQIFQNFKSAKVFISTTC